MKIRIRAKLPYFDLVIKLRPFQLIFCVPLLNRGKIRRYGWQQIHLVLFSFSLEKMQATAFITLILGILLAKIISIS